MTPPRESARKVLALLDAERTTGAVVVPVKELFLTTEAANLLGISRPTLMKYLNAGDLGHVMVGTHHRLPARALAEFERARRSHREEAAAALAAFGGSRQRPHRQRVAFPSAWMGSTASSYLPLVSS